MGDTGSLLLGQSKPYANQFVQDVQDPLKARVAAIIDPIGKKRDAGTLTYEEALAGQKALETELSAYETTATQYAGLGSSQKTVVSQAKQTLDPIFESWRAPFLKDLETLKPAVTTADPAPPSETAPTTGSILAPEGTTAATKAQGAADQQRKRSIGSGRQSTILTGPSGLGATPAANTKFKTILGY